MSFFVPFNYLWTEFYTISYQIQGHYFISFIFGSYIIVLLFQVFLVCFLCVSHMKHSVKCWFLDNWRLCLLIDVLIHTLYWCDCYFRLILPCSMLYSNVHLDTYSLPLSDLFYLFLFSHLFPTLPHYPSFSFPLPFLFCFLTAFSTK